MSLTITLILLSASSSLSPDLTASFGSSWQDRTSIAQAFDSRLINIHSQITEQSGQGPDSLLVMGTNSPPEWARVLQSQTQMCKIYDDSGLCLYCFRDQYMVDRFCTDVPIEKSIARCNIYQPDLSCYECDAGFVLSSDRKLCITGDSSLNCEKFKDQNTCETCKPGSYASGASCVVIPNCAKYLGSSCDACQSGFYLQNNSCTALLNTELIPNCSEYSADKKCQACADGFTLNNFRTVCLSKEQVKNQVDPNCLRSFINEGSFCSACVEGYYLKSGVCRQCAQNDKCLICNPIQPSECLLCRPKFHMSSNVGANCVLNNDLDAQTEDRDPLKGSSAACLKAFATLLLIIGALSRF